MKSIETIAFRWFSRKVRHVCDGGFRLLGIRRETVRSDVSHQQSEADLNLIAARLEQQYPQTNKGRRMSRSAPAAQQFQFAAKAPDIWIGFLKFVSGVQPRYV